MPLPLNPPMAAAGGHVLKTRALSAKSRALTTQLAFGSAVCRHHVAIADRFPATRLIFDSLTTRRNTRHSVVLTFSVVKLLSTLEVSGMSVGPTLIILVCNLCPSF